jgi:hypothetical protein
VNRRAEDEGSAVARGVDRPPGQRTCDIDDILLRIAAVDAEGVELEKLASVVLVESYPTSRLRRRRVARHRRGPPCAPRRHPRGDEGRTPGLDAADGVVEIDEHRRALRHRAEQVAEIAEGMRTDRALVVGEVIARLALAGEHGEVVLPEVHHDFLELTLREERTRHARGLDLGANALCIHHRATIGDTVGG